MKQTYFGLLLACGLTTSTGILTAMGQPIDQSEMENVDGLPLGEDPTSSTVTIPGLRNQVEIIRDSDGIVHILANRPGDLYLAQGWVHARDRLFQMDILRRQAAGRLAELLGPAVLTDDVETRSIGIARAAERSLEALSSETREILERYAEGVNAWIAASPLPAEYAALEIETIPAWAPLDSVIAAKALSFNLSFELDDIERTEALLAYQRVGEAAGFDGNALFFEDLFRSAPMTEATTIVAAAPSTSNYATLTPKRAEMPVREKDVEAASRYVERARRTALLGPLLDPNRGSSGSNAWVIDSELSRSGVPLIANDPHLALRTPTIFYPVHLNARAARLDTIGGSFAGVPFVITGNNQNLAWTTTVNPVDVTDVYLETLVQDPASPSGLSTMFKGALEPVQAIPESYQVNVIGDGVTDNLAPGPADQIPPATLIVPRRSEGPIISRNEEDGSAISVQWTGFSPTRELDAFRLINAAGNVEDFGQALRLFDVGSQNFMVADRYGDIAYFAASEVPLREDLQAGEIVGVPPFFIRNGSGGNEWLSASHQPDDQAVPFAIVPPEEMPTALNPEAGFLVNANNDSIGLTLDNDPLNQLRPDGGIFYLAPGFAPGLRAQRITDLIEEVAQTDELSIADMQRIQADVTLQDAIIMAPFIQEAFQNATASDADPRLAEAGAAAGVAEAVSRLAAWDQSTPTGIQAGYDAADVDGVLGQPSSEEIEHSIAATIYAAWRGRMINNTISAVTTSLGVPRPGQRQSVVALAELLSKRGIGASGIDFFEIADVSDPSISRDIVVLTSLKDGLDLLASDVFARAFNNSSNQSDYQWGKAHRLILEHPLSDPFSLTSPGNVLAPPLAGLPGVPMDGGFQTVDNITHNARFDDLNDGEANGGPSRRYVATVDRTGIEAESSLPGGASGVLGDPFATNLARDWATNESYPLRRDKRAITESAVETITLVP